MFIFKSKVSNYQNVLFQAFEEIWPWIEAKYNAAKVETINQKTGEIETTVLPNLMRGFYRYRQEVEGKDGKKFTLLIKVSLLTGHQYDGSFCKREFLNEFYIGLTTWRKSLEDMLTVFAHELAHVSQNLNGAVAWNWKWRDRKYEQLTSKPRGSNPKYTYYQKIHNQMPMEHEAELVAFATLLKHRDWKTCFRWLLNDKPYFSNIDRKTLLKKLAYLGAAHQFLEMEKNQSKEVLKEIERPNFKDLPLKLQAHEIAHVKVFLEAELNLYTKLGMFTEVAEVLVKTVDGILQRAKEAGDMERKDEYGWWLANLDLLRGNIKHQYKV